MGEIQYAVPCGSDARCPEQKLFISDCIRVPPMKEDRLETVDNASFLSKIVNCMRPKPSNEFYDWVSAVHDATMRSIIDSQLKRSRRDRRRANVTGESTSFLVAWVSICSHLVAGLPTSTRNKNALRSLNLKELPTDMVCAVSPAQNRPSGFLQSDRRTTKDG